MLHPREHLSLGSAVALQFIRDNHSWDILTAFQEFVEELLGGLFVAPALHQDIQHSPILIHSPPQIMTLCVNREKHFIEMPLVARAETPTPQLIGVLLPEFVTPLADSLIGHDDAADREQLFDISVAEAEPIV